MRMLKADKLGIDVIYGNVIGSANLTLFSSILYTLH